MGIALLTVGLLVEDGLPLLYLSIACSTLALVSLVGTLRRERLAPD